ncbi:MAG: hypothetical protein J1E06_06375 [Acutalibacter sp.]|nr:hypothetical protein [Acutalibacter sp.]
MTVFLVICGVLLFLFLLTLFPLRIHVGFEQEFSLTLRYLFLRFHIAPGKEEPEPEKKPKKKKEKTEENEKEKKVDIKLMLKRQGVSGFLQSLFELVKLVATDTKRLLSHLKLRKFDLYLCLAGAEDAAAAAIQYGQVSGAVYSACSVLFKLMRCKKGAVSVDLNYQSEESTVVFTGVLSILPIFLLREGISLLIHGLPVVMRLLKSGMRPTNQTERISQMRKQGEQQ